MAVTQLGVAELYEHFVFGIDGTSAHDDARRFKDLASKSVLSAVSLPHSLLCVLTLRVLPAIEPRAYEPQRHIW